MLSIHKSFHGESPQGHDFEIKGHFKMIGSKSSVQFKNASDDKKIELEMIGDWLDHSAEIKWDHQVVASISRKWFNPREWFGDKQTVSFDRCHQDHALTCVSAGLPKAQIDSFLF